MVLPQTGQISVLVRRPARDAWRSYGSRLVLREPCLRDARVGCVLVQPKLFVWAAFWPSLVGAGAASRTGRLAQAPPLEPCGDGCVRTGLSLFRLQLARPGFDPRDDLLRKLRWHAPVAFRLGSELRCGLYPPQRHGFQEISARECVEAEQSQRHQVVHRNRPTARITGQTRLEGARARPPWPPR